MPFCSKFKQLSACTVIMPNNAIPDKLRQGKNWFAHALALTTCLVHKSSQNLCQSIFLLQSCNLHNAMRKLQVWNQLLVICLNTTPRPTWGHSMHFYDQAGTQTPPFNQITQQGCQLTGFELRISKIYFFRESGPVEFWSPPPNSQTPPTPHPPDFLRID